MNTIYRQYLSIPIELPSNRIIQCNNINIHVNALISVLGKSYIERYGQIYSIGNNALESIDGNLYMKSINNNISVYNPMILSVDLNIKLKAEYMDAIFDRGDHRIVMRVLHYDHTKCKRVYIEWSDPKIKNINSYIKKLQSAIIETNTVYNLEDEFKSLTV